MIRTEAVGTLDQREVHLPIDIRRAVESSVGRAIEHVNWHAFLQGAVRILHSHHDGNVQAAGDHGAPAVVGVVNPGLGAVQIRAERDKR